MSQKKAQLLNPINGNINVSGVVSATSFSGDGAGLTGVASTDNIQTATSAKFLSNVNVSGITTLTTLQVTGLTTVGVLTGGTSVSATRFYGDGLDITGFSTFEDGVSVLGIITATGFVGDGTGLTGVGVGTEDSINTSGIITATTISANEFIGTGDKLIFSPSATSFSPTDGSTDQSTNTNISITFDQPIYAGVGSIFFRNSSGIGTEIGSIGIASTAISISNQTLTINTTVAFGDTVSALPYDTDVYVVLPSQSIKNAVGGFIATLSNYNFTVEPYDITSISPGAGTTNVDLTTNITLTFPEPPVRGTGPVELRSDSTAGTILESFDAGSSGQISVSGNDWILNPTSDLPLDKSIHPIIPYSGINNYVGLNTAGTDTYSFTTLAFQFSSIVPANGATSVAPDSNITITFSDVPVRGTGTVELRYTSAAGTLIESFDAASAGEISISGNDWILNPSVSFFTDPVFLVVPSTAIANFAGINVAGGAFTYSFTPTDPALGDAYEGGFLICASGGTRWIVAPQTAQVNVNWHSRGQANSCAQTISGCSGWFVPSAPQLVNPGFNCATYWDAVTAGTYWSNTQIDGRYARHVNTGGGYGNPTKTVVIATRSFRNVSY